jgi:hypothetical protein
MNMAQKTEKPAAPSAHTPAPPVKVEPALPGAFELFKPSIEMIKRNLTAFLLLLGLPTLLLLIGQGPDLASPMSMEPKDTSDQGILGLIGLIGIVALALTTPGLIMLQLRAAHGEQMQAGEAFNKGLHYFWRMLGLGIVLTVIFAVSFLLLIVPFFFALRRYFLAPYYLVDRNLGIMDSLKASADDSQGRWGAIYGIVGVVVLLALLNIVPLVGWIASAVLSFLYACSTVLRYLHFKALKEGKDPITPIESELRKAAA